MNKKERVFNIKVNKRALEKFMARLFWYVLIFITVMVFILWIFSMNELYNTWSVVAQSLLEAWILIRVPLITFIVCMSWFGLVGLFIYLVRKS